MGFLLRRVPFSIIIIFSIFRLTRQERPHFYSPTNYDGFSTFLLNNFPHNSSHGFPSFLSIGTEIRKLPQQIDAFCSINQQNVSISEKCCADIKRIFYSFIEGKSWALKMIDSLAKVPSGILRGNIFYPGDYKECMNIKVEGGDAFIPKYCQATVSVPKNKYDLTFGLCVPNSCSVPDCEHLFLKGLHMLPYHLGDQLNASIHCLQKPQFDTKAIIAIVICFVLFMFVVVGTLFDVFAIKQTDNTVSDQSPLITDVHETDSEVIHVVLPVSQQIFAHVKRFFLCFSILINLKKLLKTKLPEGNLPAVHGIRFISMTWVILGHTYFFGLSTLGNPLTALDMSKRFTFQAVIMGIYSVDTFFLLSGMLVAYGMLKILTERQGKMNWIYFYVHRFYRLTPTYAVLLMIYVCLLKYFGSGPYWYTGYDKDCSQNWWRNLLYSNNFITNGGCMGWTWYLANDMQFYLISPAIVLLLYKFPKVGIFLTLILLCIEFITSAMLFTHEKIKSPAGPAYMKLYMMPYYRIGPYLIGLLLGYVIHVTSCKKVLNKMFVCCMWLMSLAISLAVVYGFYNTNNGNSLSQPVATLYWTLSHTVWAVCVSWVIFACCSGYGEEENTWMFTTAIFFMLINVTTWLNTGNFRYPLPTCRFGNDVTLSCSLASFSLGIVNHILSWKAFIPVSRLTYSAYLIHPMVMLTYYFNLPYPMIVTDFIAIYLFLGHLVISYGLSFFVSMLIEAPLMQIESTFFPRK